MASDSASGTLRTLGSIEYPVQTVRRGRTINKKLFDFKQGVVNRDHAFVQDVYIYTFRHKRTHAQKL